MWGSVVVPWLKHSHPLKVHIHIIYYLEADLRTFHILFTNIFRHVDVSILALTSYIWCPGGNVTNHNYRS